MRIFMAGEDGCKSLAVLGGRAVDLVLIRLFFVVFVTVTCYFVDPFGATPRFNAIMGALLGTGIENPQVHREAGDRRLRDALTAMACGWAAGHAPGCS